MQKNTEELCNILYVKLIGKRTFKGEETEKSEWIDNLNLP